MQNAANSLGFYPIYLCFLDTSELDIRQTLVEEKRASNFTDKNS